MTLRAERIAVSFSLRSHQVRALIVGGLARTEVVEVLANEQARAVEARLAFVLPDGASLSRFALGRGNTLLEGRVFDSDQIALIPRGPANERWEEAGPGRNVRDTLRMRIVGFASKEKRSLVFSYDEELEQHANLEIYRYPLPRTGGAAAGSAVSVRVNMGTDQVVMVGQGAWATGQLNINFNLLAAPGDQHIASGVMTLTPSPDQSHLLGTLQIKGGDTTPLDLQRNTR